MCIRDRCKYDGKNFSKYFESDSLAKFDITSLLEDRVGNIWFSAMNKGIYRYDGTNLSNFLYKYEHPFLADKHEKMISDIIQDIKAVSYTHLKVPSRYLAHGANRKRSYEFG